jgi:hypothetical protein
MKTLKQLITDEQRRNDAADNRLRCFALNHFGAGDHPHADETSLPYFQAGYLRGCLLNLSRSKDVTPQARERAKQLYEQSQQDSQPPQAL